MTTDTETPITLAEFCKRMGVGHAAGKKIWEDATFPTVAGKLFWSDFIIWRRRKMVIPRQPTSEDRPLDAGHRASESAPKNGLPIALPPRAARLRAEAA